MLANQLLANCENDFNWLRSVFGGVTPGGLPFDVQLTTDNNGASHATCGATGIQVGANSGGPESFVSELLVAEEAEVFMDAFGQGWDCGHNNGEALSRVLADALYPRVQPDDFVSSTVWLNMNPRPNFVDTTDNSDVNYNSIGCGVLFLDWLHYVRGFSWAQIIAGGASTLAGLYQNLTGSANAWSDFTTYMNAHFPVGGNYTFEFDNPFPPLSAAFRSVFIGESFEIAGPTSMVGTGQASVSPGPLCPPQTYQYTLFSTPKRLICTANTVGFAQPAFTWSVNGVAVPDMGSVTVNALVVSIDPNADPHGAMQSVTFSCSKLDSGLSSQAFIATDAIGRISVDVQVSVLEQLIPSDPPAVRVDPTDIVTETVVWESQFYLDQRACRDRYQRLINRLRAVNKRPIWFWLPDPPPDWFAFIERMQEVTTALRSMEKTHPKETELAWTGLEKTFNITRHQLSAIATKQVQTRKASSQKKAAKKAPAKTKKIENKRVANKKR